MALAILLPLVACGGGGNTPDSAAPPASSAPASSAPGGSGPAVSTPLPSYVAPSAAEIVRGNVVDVIRFSPRDAGWNISPWMNNGNGGNSIWYQIYNCLMSNPAFGTEVGKMDYNMAESVDFSADNLTATVKLVDYIHDSKGNPIKAEDVVFSFLTAPRVSSSYAIIDNYVVDIVALDELTVKITLNKSTPGTWESLLANVPIVSKTLYENASEEERSTDPAATGAYRVKDHVAGGTTVLEAIDDFWQKDELRNIYQIANAKELHYVGITESSMRVVALENGELDAMFIDINQVQRFLDDPNWTVKEIWTTNPGNIVLNGSENSPFHDNIALRKAVLHAIDWWEAAVPVVGSGFRAALI